MLLKGFISIQHLFELITLEKELENFLKHGGVIQGLSLLLTVVVYTAIEEVCVFLALIGAVGFRKVLRDYDAANVLPKFVRLDVDKLSLCFTIDKLLSHEIFEVLLNHLLPLSLSFDFVEASRRFEEKSVVLLD
jgi:hypothetical protein